MSNSDKALHRIRKLGGLVEMLTTTQFFVLTIALQKTPEERSPEEQKLVAAIEKLID